MKKMALIILSIVCLIFFGGQRAEATNWVVENRRLTRQVQELQWGIQFRDNIISELRGRRELDPIVLYNRLDNFLAEDDTDKLEPSSNFKCMDYSWRLRERAKEKGLDLSIAFFVYENNPVWHAVNVALTEAGWYVIEPQTDQIITAIPKLR